MFNEFHHQVRGRAHQRDGTIGQDRTHYLSLGGVHVVGLADGAGSSPHSHLGAQTVVREVCALLTQRFDEFVATPDASSVRASVLERLRSALQEVKSRHDLVVSDLASTLLCVAIKDGRFLAMHLGDGVIGRLTSSGLQVVSGPDNSEFVNETTFVTSARADRSLRLIRGSMVGTRGFILMSDGSCNALFDMRSQELAPACAKLIDFVGAARRRSSRDPKYKRTLRKFVDQRVRGMTNDDCSLVVIARRG